MQVTRLPCFDWDLPPASAFRKMSANLRVCKMSDTEQPVLVLPDNWDDVNSRVPEILQSIRTLVDQVIWMVVVVVDTWV